MDNFEDRLVLETKLAELVGMEDGVADIVDHLLTISSTEELMYFLNEFFGSQNDQMEDIARNVVRFQNNEPLEWKQVHTKMPAAQSITKSVVTASAEITRLDNPSAQKQSTTVQQNKAAISIIPKQPKGKPSRVPKAVSPVKVESSTTANEAVKQTGEKGNDKPTTKPSAIPLPPKGEAKVDCGCFGTTHRALINCLFCGRILCEREGYGFCPHCGYLVEEDNENMRRQWVSDKAWQLKEDLLYRDRQKFRGAAVAGDHVDSTTAWNTSEEQKLIQQREEERERIMHGQKTMQLKLRL